MIILINILFVRFNNQEILKQKHTDMQVDEEVKGQAAASNHDIGCYENDDEDEREIKEAEEGAKDVIFALNEAGTAHVAQVGANQSTLVVCACLQSQSLAKIMYGADWQQVGEATTQKTASKNDDEPASAKEPKSIMTLYAFNGTTPVYFALPDVEKMGGDAVNIVVNQLFG